MAFSSTRTPTRFSSLGAGSRVRAFDMSNLDHLPELLGCQLGASIHRNLGRTAKAGQTQTHGGVLVHIAAVPQSQQSTAESAYFIADSSEIHRQLIEVLGLRKLVGALSISER